MKPGKSIERDRDANLNKGSWGASQRWWSVGRDLQESVRAELCRYQCRAKRASAKALRYACGTARKPLWPNGESEEESGKK